MLSHSMAPCPMVGFSPQGRVLLHAAVSSRNSTQGFKASCPTATKHSTHPAPTAQTCSRGTQGCTHMVLLILKDGSIEGPLLLLLWGESHTAGEPPGESPVWGEDPDRVGLCL